MIALVTGAHGTLGAAVCDELKRQGFNIIRHHHTDREIEEAFYVDVLVNCAGVYGPIGPLFTSNWAEWEKTIEVNLLGTVKMCKLVLPGMIARDHGKIINLSGGGATKARPNFSAYSTSKAAVVRFTETLAEEVAQYHIDVNAVAPGMMRTALTEKVIAAGPELAGEKEYQEAKGCDIMPEKAAKLIAFLASHESDGITGRLVSVHDSWERLRAKDFENAPDRYRLRRNV